MAKTKKWQRLLELLHTDSGWGDEKGTTLEESEERGSGHSSESEKFLTSLGHSKKTLKFKDSQNLGIKTATHLSMTSPSLPVIATVSAYTILPCLFLHMLITYEIKL